MSEETVICTYRVRADREDAFVALLERHWRTLHDLGVVNDEPAVIYRSLGEAPPVFVEVFTWKEGGFQRAHEHPRVVAIWEPMDTCCEDREGRPGMEFPHFRRIESVSAS